MRVMGLLTMPSEIVGLPHEVESIETDRPDHYVCTPHAYQPLGRRFVPPLPVDLGQGLLELIEEVQKECLSQGQIP